MFAQSEWIVRYADAHLPPELRLFTGEETELCRWLDAGLGPDSRRLIYKHMLPRKRLMLPYNNQGVPAWEARALSALYPVATRWARRELSLTPTDDVPLVFAAFDAIAERLADGRRHLCGDRFTAADLTFASPRGGRRAAARVRRRAAAGPARAGRARRARVPRAPRRRVRAEAVPRAQTHAAVGRS